MQIVLGGTHTHTRAQTHTRSSTWGFEVICFHSSSWTQTDTRHTQTAVPDSQKTHKPLSPSLRRAQKDRHTPTQRDKRTRKEEITWNLKRRHKQRETGGGWEKKKGETDEEVCVLLKKKKKNRETEGYICATDAVAVEIQTPNTADKNAGWLVICGEKEPRDK